MSASTNQSYMKKRCSHFNVKHFLFGSREKNGFIKNFSIYALLIMIGFIFLYPILYMFITSIKSLPDLLDDTVKWIPRSLYLDNYKQALEVMRFKETALNSFVLAFASSACQVITACVTGYGFARYDFKFKPFWLIALFVTFTLPQQATMIPTYSLYKDMNLIGTMWPFIASSALGQGINAPIIVLIFYQFFKQLPKPLIEAAQLDGCGEIGIFFRIAIPTAAAGFIIGFIFSFVWYWNETYLTSIFISGTGMGQKKSISTLLLELEKFEASYKALYPEGATAVNRINESIRMAGTVLCVSPLLILYFIMQRFFVESVDRIGIKG